MIPRFVMWVAPFRLSISNYGNVTPCSVLIDVCLDCGNCSSTAQTLRNNMATKNMNFRMFISFSPALASLGLISV
jgi:hypothetical protein